MNYQLIDTHAHLNLKRLFQDIDIHLQNCTQNNITKIIVPGIDLPSSQKALELAHLYPNQIIASAGIHPESVIQKDFSNQLFIPLEEILKDPQICAIGEIGLDYYYAQDQTLQQLQISALIAQIKLAVQYNKSVIIHSRQSAIDLIQILNQNWVTALEGRVVFHCCEPNMQLLDFALKHKIFIGVDGDITYDESKMDFISHVPLVLLVLETDSPYLLPEPLRSSKSYPNVPANLLLIAQAVASIKQVSINQIADETTYNALSLFNLN